MSDTDQSILDLIKPSLFSYETVTAIKAARFTLFDLLHLYGKNTEHKDVMAMVDAEWSDDPEDKPPLVVVMRTRYQNVFEVQTYELTLSKTVRLLSRGPGASGRANRARAEKYQDALLDLVEERHAAAEKGKVDLLIAASLITSSQLTKMAMRGHLKKQSKADIVDFALAEEQAWRERYAAAGVSPPSSGEEYEALYAVIKHEAGERTRALEDAKKRTAALPTTKEIRK